MIYFILPFLLQAAAIIFDEFYFHVRRGLPKWERIGHPVDTFSVLICFIWVVVMPFTPENLKIYIFLAAFSCLMVTKDEFVHKHHCKASENWLHALLFILHPICLTCAGLIWPIIQKAPAPKWLILLLDRPAILEQFITMQAGIMGLFFFYQVIYWNFLWKKQKVIRY